MFAHIPVWVFAVLALLLGLGLMQARTRLVAPALIRAVAFGLLAYSLWGVVSSFGLLASVVTAWLAGVGVSAVLGRTALSPRGLSHDAATDKVRVPGSWLPLVLLMGIFGLKFAVGYAAGTGAPIAAGSPASAAIALSLGLLSGAFFARAHAVVAVAAAARRESQLAYHRGLFTSTRCIDGPAE